LNSFSADSNIGDESLDFWCFLSGFSVSGGPFSSDDTFLGELNFVFLQSKQFSDFVGSLWSQMSWDVGVGKSWNIVFSFLGDGEGQNSDVISYDTSSNGFSSSFSGSSWSITLLVLVQQDSNSSLKL